jgi:DNA-binding MarR family transcriptional regulator
MRNDFRCGGMMVYEISSNDKETDSKKHHLTVNEKILLHLLENHRSQNLREAPLSITQKGIAENVKIRWNHVPRAMHSLKKQGYVTEDMSHIEGKTRRQKAYFLTDEGLLFAKNLRERILGWDVFLRRSDGQVAKLKLSRVNMHLKTKFTPLWLYMSLKDEIIDEKGLISGEETKTKKKESRIFFTSGELVWPEELIGRESEIQKLSDVIDSDKFQTIVIYGSVGIGKSALMAVILKMYKEKKNIFWYQLSERDSESDVLRGLGEFLSRLSEPDLLKYLEGKSVQIEDAQRILGRGLKEKETILAFDNYFNVTEKVADLFSYLCDLAEKNKALKVIIGARDTTPFYCRFYDKNEIAKRRIAELTIKGLDKEGIKSMLGTPNIDNDALKKIHLMTRGHPLTIELIKKGDVNSLKRIKGFSRQEASLLLYLKGVEKTQ